MKITATLAVSSSWFHGSMTKVGGSWDGQAISDALKNVYQVATSSISTNSTIFLTVSDDLEPTTISEVTDDITFIALDESLPVSDWIDYITDLPSKTYQRYGVALIAFGCTLGFPFSLCECIIKDVIAPEFLDESGVEFIREKYLPELKTVTSNEGFPVAVWDGIPFMIRFIGVVTSFLWALLFQEKTLPIPCLEGQLFNLTWLGALKSPFVDFILSEVTDIGNSEEKAYNGKEEYPGAKYCNRVSPHALWHELSADALFKVIIVGDEMNKLLTERKEKRKKNSNFFSAIASRIKSLRGSSVDD